MCHKRYTIIDCVKTLSLKLCFGKYCYENGNGILKMINKSSKNKNNGLVYMINEYTKIYRNNISVKNRGQRSKQATTKCSIKKADKQATITLQATCLHLQIFFEGKGIIFNCIHQTAYHAILKARQSKQRRSRKNSISLVRKHVACEGNNFGLKIFVIKIY